MKHARLIIGSLLVAGLVSILLLLVVRRPQQPATPLSLAAVQGDAAQMRKLIAQGADVNARDKDGLTSLMWAARKGDVEAARLLIEARADVNVRDCGSAGWTPLMHAIHKNQNDLARLLIERGADVNATAGDCHERKQVQGGKTALAYAAANDNAEIVKALLAKGANPYGMHGARSALSYAVAGTLEINQLFDGKCPTETVKALLESAPDLNVQRNVWDRKSIFIARLKGCTELLDILEKRKSALSVNESGSRLGSHLVKVSPACETKENSSEGNKHRFSCGDTTVVTDGGKLTVNGQSYGALKQGDSVKVERGKVRVNAGEINASRMVASN